MASVVSLFIHAQVYQIQNQIGNSPQQNEHTWSHIAFGLIMGLQPRKKEK
jgi:hypothetical protein